MPADFSDYVNLRIFDVTPGDAYLAAIDMARLTLPEFNLRVGTPEDAIFQAMAYLSSLNIAAINRLPDRLMAGILLMMGVPRQDGTPAEVELLLTADSYDGGTIPSGTVFSFTATFEDEVQEFVFETVDNLTIAAKAVPTGGYPTGTVFAQALSPGMIPVLSDGDELDIISSGIPIISAIVNGSFTNGINADTDTEYLSRATTYLSSLSGTLNKASQVESYLLTRYSGVVGRVKCYDLTYGATGVGEIGVYREQSPVGFERTSNVAKLHFSSTHQFLSGEKVYISGLPTDYADPAVLYTITSASPTFFTYSKAGTDSASVNLSASTPSVYIGDDIAGYVTNFIYGLNQPVAAADKDVILADLSARSVAGLTYTILDPTICTLSISASVVLNAAFDQEPLQDSVKAALLDYISPMVFPYTEDRIRYTTLISIISRIPGVLYVTGLDITGTGTGWLPKVGDDLQFQYKGSLPSLSSDDISMTFTSLEL